MSKKEQMQETPGRDSLKYYDFSALNESPANMSYQRGVQMVQFNRYSCQLPNQEPWLCE